MRRTSDQHSAWRDDQLEREEAALLQGTPDEGRSEPRRGEDTGLDEARAAPRPDVEGPYHGAPGVDEIEDRAALAVTFTPSMFPAHREELVEAAEQAYAEEWLIRELERLPEGPYNHVTDVWTQLRATRARVDEQPGARRPQ